MTIRLTCGSALSAILFSMTVMPVAPAWAQDSAETGAATVRAERPATVFDGDYLTVGIAGGVAPSYEGSDDYVLFPAGALMGSLGGIEFQARGPGLNVDLVPDTRGASYSIIAGPVVRLRTDRDAKPSSIKEPAVAALGRLDTAIEIGGEVGVKMPKLLNPYDSLTASVEARWDVAGAHKGRIIAPRVTYFTPLSRALAASVSVQAEHIDDSYADYYFTVSPAGAAASGLSAFQADGGWKSVGGNLFLAADLDGDITNGGWGAFANMNYSRLTGDAGRSPIASEVGSRNQFFALVGVGYTF